MDLSTLGAEDRVSLLKDAVIRLGDKGPEVLELQTLLKKAGFLVDTDGVFGGDTEKAVRAAQKKAGLVADGLAGPKTFDALKNVKPAKPQLTHDDVVWAANELGCKVAAVMAVNEVESKGEGFFKDGRPVILFERHIMARMLGDHGINYKSFMQSSPGLVNTASGGYVGGVREYDRLENAKKISVEAALESASWGAYQIMGFHWELLGYSSIQAFVAEMYKGERQQLEAFVKFIKSQPALLKAMRACDWVSFARYYNGASYAKNKYDTKLKAAFDRNNA